MARTAWCLGAGLITLLCLYLQGVAHSSGSLAIMVNNKFTPLPTYFRGGHLRLKGLPVRQTARGKQ